MWGRVRPPGCAQYVGSASSQNWPSARVTGMPPAPGLRRRCSISSGIGFDVSIKHAVPSVRPTKARRPGARIATAEVEGVAGAARNKMFSPLVPDVNVRCLQDQRELSLEFREPRL